MGCSEGVGTGYIPNEGFPPLSQGMMITLSGCFLSVLLRPTGARVLRICTLTRDVLTMALIEASLALGAAGAMGGKLVHLFTTMVA